MALQEDLLPVPASLFQGSLLLGGVARAVLGPASVGAPTLIHPAFITGWCGLVVSALNLLPVGSLDGGRMMQVSPLPLIEDRWPHTLSCSFPLIFVCRLWQVSSSRLQRSGL